MADKTVPNQNDKGVIEKYTDMGDGTWRLNVIANGATVTAGAAGFPAGATPVAGNASGANAIATATLANVASKTTYLTSIVVTGNGATAAAIATATLSGIIGGSSNYIIVVPGSANSQVIFSLQFAYPIPASAPNTAISLAVSAFGAGNTNVNVQLVGFQA